jgi:hypothetical protein
VSKTLALAPPYRHNRLKISVITTLHEMLDYDG